MEYQKDLIAARDSYIKLHSSVVKWWRDKNAIEEYNRQVEEYNRQVEEMMRTQTQEQAVAEEPEVSDADFNATTGTYSGAYGKNAHLNDDEKNQVADILAHNNDVLRDLIDTSK